MLNGLTLSGGKIPPSASPVAEVAEGAGTAMSRYAKPEKAYVAIVEDNPGDVFMMEEALREHNLHDAVTVLSNGEEAVSFFDRLEHDLTASCPDIVLLDLNLPKYSGHGVLARIRAGRRCASAPVVIVSSSEAEADLAENRRLGATAYFKKPSRLDDFMKLGALVNSLLGHP